jgi:hypothetical protein
MRTSEDKGHIFHHIKKKSSEPQIIEISLVVEDSEINKKFFCRTSLSILKKKKKVKT